MPARAARRGRHCMGCAGEGPSGAPARRARSRRCSGSSPAPSTAPRSKVAAQSGRSAVRSSVHCAARRCVTRPVSRNTERCREIFGCGASSAWTSWQTHNSSAVASRAMQRRRIGSARAAEWREVRPCPYICGVPHMRSTGYTCRREGRSSRRHVGLVYAGVCAASGRARSSIQVMARTAAGSPIIGMDSAITWSSAARSMPSARARRTCEWTAPSESHADREREFHQPAHLGFQRTCVSAAFAKRGVCLPQRRVARRQTCGS